MNTSVACMPSAETTISQGLNELKLIAVAFPCNSESRLGEVLWGRLFLVLFCFFDFFLFVCFMFKNHISIQRSLVS